jgi:DNA-directed RNA polymerase alpha subunit
MQENMTFSLEYWKERADFFEDYIRELTATKIEVRNHIVERMENENRQLRDLLVKLMDSFSVHLGRPEGTPPPQDVDVIAKVKSLQARRIRLEELELSIRVFHALKQQDIETLGDVCKYSEAELLRYPNFGRKSLNELKEILSFHGLSLASRTQI